MKNKFIKVYDNIFPPFLKDSFYNVVFKEEKLRWKYSDNIAGDDAPYTFPGISHVFFGQGSPNEVTEFCDYFLHPLHYFCSNIKMQIYNIVAGRIFMNFPIIGASEKSLIHTDINDQHWVALYYINDSDGDTILYEDDQITELTRISPKKGRIILFDGTIPHTGSYPTQNSRAIINFNFFGDFYE